MGTDKSCGPPSFRGPFEAFEAFWWLLAPLGGFLAFLALLASLKWRGAQNHQFQYKKKHSSLVVRPSWPGALWRGGPLDPGSPCPAMGGPWPAGPNPEPKTLNRQTVRLPSPFRFSFRLGARAVRPSAERSGSVARRKRPLT